MRSQICSRWATGVLVVLVMISGGVSPAVAAAATADESARAKAKLKSGARSLDDGEYEQALVSFQEAYQIVPNPKIFFNFGLAYTGLARHADALESFERFINEAHDAAAESRADAERRIAGLRKRVGTLSITCDTDGAEVRLDGKKLGATPLEKKVYVQAGSHQVVVRRGDGAPFVRDFTAVAGGDLQLAAKLVVPPALVAGPSSLKPAENSDPPTLIDRPAQDPDAEKQASNKWLIWGIAGGLAAAAAVVLVVLLGRSTSYPKTDGTVFGNGN